ncbi:hypothetical protein ACRCUN_33460 [Mycobacterium sp. LTG2003]
MAIHAGRNALAAAAVPSSDVAWVVHGGSGYQGSAGWPVHHQIQHGIVGNHGNAFELRQLCAGGLTAWLISEGLTRSGGAVLCTGADNWSWEDRFAAARTTGGEPFSDSAHASVLSAAGGFARIVGIGTASCPDQAQPWQTRKKFWEHATMSDFRATVASVAESRTPEAARDSFNMLIGAVTSALKNAQISPQYVTHFVPHGTASGEPYRSLAKALDLPWSESLYQNSLDHGYLGVSTQAAGLVHLAQAEDLTADSIVLLVASEYQLSSTAVVLHIMRTPMVTTDGPVFTLHEVA